MLTLKATKSILLQMAMLLAGSSAQAATTCLSCLNLNLPPVNPSTQFSPVASSPLTMTLPAIGGPGAFGVIVFGAGSSYDIKDSLYTGVANDYFGFINTYNGWCLEQSHPVVGGPVIATSTYNNPPAPAAGSSAYNKINYLLNNKQGTVQDVQDAIWGLTSGVPPTSATALPLYNDANANGAGFVPGPGQIIGVYLYVDGYSATGGQEFLIEVTNPCAAIGDFVWWDQNSNGLQDGGEPGIPNVTVQLINGTTNAAICGTATDTNGKYLFTNIPPGLYHLYVNPTQAALVSYTPTVQGNGTQPTIDSDAGASGVTANTTLDAGEKDLNWDFGYTKVATDACTSVIGDYVWYDLNGNGIQDAGEPGVSFWTVKLTGTTTGGVAVNKTTVTDINGKYSFGSLCAGSYTVTTATPPGTSPTLQNAGTIDNSSKGNPVPVILPVNTTNLTIDTGFKPGNACGLTWGYWKNHLSAWPVTSLYLGSRLFSKTELLSLLGKPVGGDQSINLAHQLIAAKLNVFAGTNIGTAGGAILAADQEIIAVNNKLPTGSNNPQAANMNATALLLDRFNSDGIAQPGCLIVK
jgi:hypothetical protein